MPEMKDAMQPPLRPDGLQLSEPTEFQRRSWAIQRWCWMVFGIILISALAGLTGGGGYFSRQNVELGDVRIDLPLISRWEDSDDATVYFSGEGPDTLTLGTDFHAAFVVESIYPQPSSQTVSADGTILEFASQGGGSRQVQLALRAAAPGIAEVKVSSGDATGSATVFILP